MVHVIFCRMAKCFSFMSTVNVFFFNFFIVLWYCEYMDVASLQLKANRTSLLSVQQQQVDKSVYMFDSRLS